MANMVTVLPDSSHAAPAPTRRRRGPDFWADLRV